MFTPTVRLILLLLLSTAAVFLAMAERPFWLLMASILSLFLLWDYRNRNTVPLALRRLAAGRYAEANHLLRHVRNPDKLNRESRAYYYFIQGMYYRDNDQYQEAIEALTRAKNIGIKNHNFKAMNYIALADIAIIQKEKALAKQYISDIQSLKVNDSIAQSIQKIRNYLTIP